MAGNQRRAALAAALALFVSAASSAQAPASEGVAAPAAAPESESADSAAARPCCMLPAGFALDIEIAEPVSSRTHSRGHRFRIRLVEPAIVDGRVLLPVGTTGVGEVVHSARSSFGGKPGELLLAARYLEHGGVQIPVRGLRYGARGRDNSNAAFAANVFAGPLGMLISGNEVRFPAGTVGSVLVTADTGVAAAE